MPTLDSVITNYFVPLLPGKWRLPFIYRRYCASAAAEQELVRLEKISRQFRVAIDIGANQGLYSYKMSRHFRQVYAFEINADLTANLHRYAAGNIRIIDEGLSSRAGDAILYTPVLENGFALTGWASLSKDDLLEEIKSCPGKMKIMEKPVRIGVLDSFKLEEVDFIKIDVEGHELEVLKGARETLRANHPRLLIETKGRLPEVDALLADWQYRRVSLDDVIGVAGSPDLYLYAPLQERAAAGSE